jgi:hypothetical protein
MKPFFLLLGFFIFQSAFAQEVDTTAVKVHKDPRMETLSKKHASINAAIKKASARTMRGYRLLIVNTTKRDEAMDAKTKIYTYFPELKAYLVYQSPYFKLKAGNFKTREEADKYRTNLNSLFPNGVFILNDMIEVTPEKESENKEL